MPAAIVSQTNELKKQRVQIPFADLIEVIKLERINCKRGVKSALDKERV